MRRRSFLAGALAPWTPSVARGQTLTFEVGQVWTLKPPLEASARVRIGRIEDSGATIHISLWGVEAPVPEVTDVAHSPMVLGHLPITASALAASVASLSTDEPPDNLPFEEGYAAWQADRGGVFTITVAEIVNALLETIRSGQARYE